MEVRASCLLCSGRTAAACRTASSRGVGQRPGWDLRVPFRGLHGTRSAVAYRNTAVEDSLLSILLRHAVQPYFIICSIGTQIFDKALCDLVASVSVMPKAVFGQLNYSVLTPRPIQ